MPGGRPHAGSPRSAPGRSPGWLGRLPRWLHGIPYVALLVLGGVLLAPGVVPIGPQCNDYTGAPLAERLGFIQWSAVAFGLVAGLLTLSAVVASAQRRGGRPGPLTIAGALVLGAVTLAAVISPHGPASYLVRFLMAIDSLGLLCLGVGLAVPATAASMAWSTLRGPESLRIAQISAWTTVLYVLPLIMTVTYEFVTPPCLGQ